ncbi:MAG: hypothetical protein CVU18_06980 [Betaproteobacteria bacterium HGW-Betaproteobacteria-12]|nr:MAG: hypothetical protein CVU18_06980 [Betaproteobacteria bacterium HGW-Betaproteobacteria-12]
MSSLLIGFFAGADQIPLAVAAYLHAHIAECELKVIGAGVHLSNAMDPGKIELSHACQHQYMLIMYVRCRRLTCVPESI